MVILAVAVLPVPALDPTCTELSSTLLQRPCTLRSIEQICPAPIVAPERNTPEFEKPEFTVKVPPQSLLTGPKADRP